MGRRSVRARGYFLVEGAAELVSEGAWFWHPGEGQVRGYFTASGMPAALFDYRTRFEGNTMVHDLRSYGANGEEAAYIETWEFLDDARYVWRLLRQTPDGPKEEMSGTYTRRRE